MKLGIRSDSSMDRLNQFDCMAPINSYIVFENQDTVSQNMSKVSGEKTTLNNEKVDFPHKRKKQSKRSPGTRRNFKIKSKGKKDVTIETTCNITEDIIIVSSNIFKILKAYIKYRQQLTDSSKPSNVTKKLWDVYLTIKVYHTKICVVKIMEYMAPNGKNLKFRTNFVKGVLSNISHISGIKFSYNHIEILLIKMTNSIEMANSLNNITSDDHAFHCEELFEFFLTQSKYQFDENEGTPNLLLDYNQNQLPPIMNQKISYRNSDDENHSDQSKPKYEDICNDSGYDSPRSFSSIEEVIQTLECDTNLEETSSIILPELRVSSPSTSSCAVCGTTTINKCLGCCEVSYCSTMCQNKHWSSHRYTCFKIQIEKQKRENNSSVIESQS